MDSDLIAAARALAERGWLPGIDVLTVIPWVAIHTRYATEADLHLAAHREIVRREWVYQFDEGANILVPNIESCHYVPGTTTLSLLRALLAACEAQEKTNGS